MKIVDVIDNEELDAAEEEWRDINGDTAPQGLYEYASSLAYLALVRILEDHMQEVLEALKDLAGDQMSQF